jgi:hypothetical protein
MELKIESGVSCKQGKILLTIQLSKSHNSAVYMYSLSSAVLFLFKEGLNCLLDFEIGL